MDCNPVGDYLTTQERIAASMYTTPKHPSLPGVLGLVGIVLSTATCTTVPEDPKYKEVAIAQQPILNGTLDLTHDAVVYILGDGGACTGTMVKVDATKKVGWVLTAAHCINTGANQPTLVIQGNDVGALPNQLRRYTVLDAAAHPSYNPNTLTHDLGMVRVYGVDAQTPVIPVATASDGLSLRKKRRSATRSASRPA
jgi:Trypsin